MRFIVSLRIQAAPNILACFCLFKIENPHPPMEGRLCLRKQGRKQTQALAACTHAERAGSGSSLDLQGLVLSRREHNQGFL